MQEEIEFCRRSYEKKDGIRKLSKQLRALDIAQQKQQILETTGNTNPGKEMLNEVAYLPLCHSATEYALH